MMEISWLEEIILHMRVHPLRAALFHCESSWELLERVLGNDMFFYVIAGRGEMVVEDRRYSLKAGSCAHFRRQLPHSARHDPKHPFTVMTVHYDATVFETLTVADALGFPDHFDFAHDEEAKSLCQQSLEEQTSKPLGHERRFELLASLLLLHLIREDRHRKLMQLDYHDTRRDNLRRLLPALKRMGAKLEDPNPIQTLAGTVGLSESQFRRLFVDTIHMSPVRYLRRLRVDRACWLLRNTTLTIESIAGNVGYSETAFFAHTFKRLMGIPPGQYRTRTDE